MILKMLSSENLDDDNFSKGCRVVDNVCEVHFHQTDIKEEHMLSVTYRSPNRGLLVENFILSGNAYLMNNDGKTIQSFACDSYR